MTGRVLVKLGGALLTEKQRYKTIDKEALEITLRAVSDAARQGEDLILVLGAGSFGHSLARHLRLNEGYLPDWTPSSSAPWGEIVPDQLQGLDNVRSDLNDLSSHITSLLVDSGFDVSFTAAREFARYTESGDVDWSPPPLTSQIEITQGDIIDREGPSQFGILSGDQLMHLFAEEVALSRAVFALDGIDGLMTHPPDHPSSSLIEWFAPGDVATISVDETHDVTGGMGAKVEIACAMSRLIPVTFVNGKHSRRLTDAILGQQVRGTLVSIESPSV